MFTVALREYFSQFGAVERSQVLFDRNTGRSKRFGFVVFKDEASIGETMNVSHHEIHDTEIFVQPHKPPKSNEKSKKDKDPLDMMITTEQE
ncbi:SRA stem-loop-interacting RNA-binding, mitochondrial [Paramuricea clavata]|uniref:SRA stem-loop-interacting RNA-binding, mitochondrial n=1 Tax=Paramuricea clavata TaxID=317549 RepID=A0A6S7J7M8_PARCT|nr:SRA stem-loop-interacting RNA-binding, mitochondrial [Paramuricea clavata]